jgi:hypothetical protein
VTTRSCCDTVPKNSLNTPQFLSDGEHTRVASNLPRRRSKAQKEKSDAPLSERAINSCRRRCFYSPSAPGTLKSGPGADLIVVK